MFPWIIVAVLLIAAAALFIRSRAAGSGIVGSAQISQLWRQPPRPIHRPAVERKDFSAVSIQCGPGACKAARVLEGKRGFPNQIPRVPLSQCDAASCTCTYKEHADRRSRDDRRRLYATFSGAEPDSDERRRADERRHGEHDTELEGFNFTDT